MAVVIYRLECKNFVVISTNASCSEAGLIVIFDMLHYFVVSREVCATDSAIECFILFLTGTRIAFAAIVWYFVDDGELESDASPALIAYSCAVSEDGLDRLTL